MKRFNRVMLGAKSAYAEQCIKEGFIGADYDIKQDLSKNLNENWRDFNKEFIPIWLTAKPEKKKIAAGLACGMLWTICAGLNKGDIVLSPDGKGNYYVGEITGYYYYKPDHFLPHRRPVNWFTTVLRRTDFSPELQHSTNSIGTVCDITKYAVEIESLLANKPTPVLITSDDTIEDPSTFALEKHLEDFLIMNWKNTLLGKDYDIYQEEGELVGQQFPTDTGPIDILAISKDKKTLLVVELKKGRASDNVVGQVQRYMGYVKEQLADTNQKIQGIIIALEDDIRIKRALSVTSNIEFYKYQVNFKLYK